MFKEKSALVRNKASMIYEKFKVSPLSCHRSIKNSNLFSTRYLQLLFLTPEGQNFWDNFAEHLEKFKEDCKSLSDESLVRLTEDPSSKSKPP